MINNKVKTIPKQSIAHIDGTKCIGCGGCKRNCEYGAIFRGQEFYIVDEQKCQGCKVCSTICPADAITYI